MPTVSPSEIQKSAREIFHIDISHDRAQELNDFNLITLVKKSYDALGVNIPNHIF